LTAYEWAHKRSRLSFPSRDLGNFSLRGRTILNTLPTFIIRCISSLAPHHENVFPFPAVNLSATPWDFILILIVLAVLVPWRGTVKIRRLLAQPALTSSQRLSLYASTIAFQSLLVAAVSWRSLSRHLSPDELGLVVSGGWQTLLIAVIFTALLCVYQLAGLRRFTRLPADRRGFLFRFREKITPQTPMEGLAFVALACTAGLSEEFVYRGFVFAVFSRVFESSTFPVLPAVVTSSVWFAMAHLYQGRRGMITTFVVGLLFSATRIWTGNLVPAIAGHIGVDLIAGLYAPRLLRSRPEEETRADTRDAGKCS
jgi:membrane protease YdiL (CAAX protease family)